jgi:SlyX protein
MENRLTGAEEQIAHLTRMVEDLSDIVARQQGDLDALTRRFERLIARDLDQDGASPLTDQRPPHW